MEEQTQGEQRNSPINEKKAAKLMPSGKSSEPGQKQEYWQDRSQMLDRST
jgi:hypothetical protein